MSYRFEDYKIRIGNSANYSDKFVGTIEELHNVIAILDSKDQAEEVLRPLFDKEISRLKTLNEAIPRPGDGKAKLSFAANDKILALRPFIDQFWQDIFGTSFINSFVSDESTFASWDHYLRLGKDELIDKVRLHYNFDISSIYDRPLCEILGILRMRLSKK